MSVNQGKELDYIEEVIKSGHLSGDGHFTNKCQTLLEQALGSTKVLLTTSCTDALEMAALLLEVKPGDEVIIPSFTFVSTANAFILAGAKPVFIDIRSDTLNMDESHLEHLITDRTKAIVPVHYAGVGCEMDRILHIAKKSGIAVVEDNAHGLFGKFKGKYLGTWGCLATQSFHETKNFTCGEGGALLINAPEYLERSEIIWEKGTNRKKFIRKQTDKYTWVDLGSSYLPSEILAAFLYAQLEAREKIQMMRKRIWLYYYENLQEWALHHGVQLPIVPEHCEQAFHMFYLVFPSQQERLNMIAHLKSHNIVSAFHYQPLHLSQMGQKFGGRKGNCPMAENISERLLRLPFHNELTHEQQIQIVNEIFNFKNC